MSRASICKSIRIYIGVIILAANTLYNNFCLFKQIPTVSKWLKIHVVHKNNVQTTLTFKVAHGNFNHNYYELSILCKRTLVLH